MRARAYVLPLAMLGAIAGFVAFQAMEVSRAPAGSTVPAGEPSMSGGPVSPQGDPASATARTDAPAPAEVVITADARAPRFDTASVRVLLREGAPGTYLEELLRQQDRFLVRWPEGRPLRVWIDRNAAVAGWDWQYPAVAERAFGEWQLAGFPLRFEMLVEPRDVDIRVRWIDRLAAGDASIGIAKKLRNQYGWLVESEITIATHDSGGRVLPPAIVAGIARHEIGHALGLGHSSNPADVMYPESSSPVISEADRKTLRLLYQLPPGRMP